MKNELTIKNLSYDNLNDVTFSLKKGSVCALIGKNSSSKTKLMKCIAGLLPYSGTVSLNGTIITNFTALNENVGIYLNNVNLSNDTVFSNLLEPLINLDINIGVAKNKVYDCLKKLEIENIMYRNINTLSYSEKKFVAIAKSIIHEPKIMLLDNPFDSLNIYQKNSIIKYISKIKRSQNSTLIFTTNNCEDLLLVDNIIIISDGKIISNKSKNELFENEKLFIRNGLHLPFIVDLSHKLKAYELIDHIIYETNEMVDEIWK